MFFSGIFQAPKSFIETKRLINYQGYSTEAKPMNGPFLQREAQTTGPKKDANDSARGERETKNAAEPFLSRPSIPWQGVSNTFKDGKGPAFLGN
jgi:hypothetical protein